MSKFMLSDYIYKFLGMNNNESQIILQKNRGSEYPKFMTSDSRLLKSQRYAGLTNMDAMLAEQANNEFGHLTDPVKALELKYKRRNQK